MLSQQKQGQSEPASLAPIHFDIKENLIFSLDNEEIVIEWLLAVAEKHKRSLSNLEYVFCTDEELLEINKQYLNHDYYTDIITFPMSSDPLEACIYISIDRVKENAEHYETAFVDELHRVLVHGLLHLLGHNDKTNEENKAMRKAEDDCLNQRSFA